MQDHDELLFDAMPYDDELTPGLEEMIEVIRRTTDPLALPALAELLEHPHPSVQSAAVEALVMLGPSGHAIRRQLDRRAAARVRDALGWGRGRPTREARAALRASRGCDADDEDGRGDQDEDRAASSRRTRTGAARA
jgi:hypothetical protein